MHTFQPVYEVHSISAFHLLSPSFSMLLVALLKPAKLFCNLQLKSVIYDLTVVLPQAVLLSLSVFSAPLMLWYFVHR